MTSGNCQAFVYGGCEGNANRFESTEQCERHCGEFLGQGTEKKYRIIFSNDFCTEYYVNLGKNTIHYS